MIRAVLLDRDGTLIADDPCGERVAPMPKAKQALELLRYFGIKIGIATNQSRVGEGLQSMERMNEIHALIESALGEVDGWFICTHARDAKCDCRKPQPGLILQAAQTFGISAAEIAMIGDIGTDVEAAHAAGAHAILVPTRVTRQEEIDHATIVCRDLVEAVVVAVSGVAA